jgi:DNA mismatch endonuclease (patch repair protein)
MADVHSKEVRSHNMSRIRSKNTKPELIVRKFLFANGFRYRLHNKSLPGKPDIVLNKYNTIIFIHGCFWHKHKNCKYAFVPASNKNYWFPKLDKNVEKDIQATKRLREMKWKVLIVWECNLKPNKQEKTLQKILNYVKDKN